MEYKVTVTTTEEQRKALNEVRRLVKEEGAIGLLQMELSDIVDMVWGDDEDKAMQILQKYAQKKYPNEENRNPEEG